MRLAALMLVCGCHAAATRAEPPPVAAVHRGTIVDRVVLTGTLHAGTAIDLGLPIPWQTPIRWIAADGASVKAGERVLEFDNSLLLSTLADNRAQLKTAEAERAHSSETTAKAVADKRRAIRNAEIDLEKARLQAELPADLMSVQKAQENVLAVKQAERSVAESRRGLATLIATNALDRRIVQITLDQRRRAIDVATAALDSLVVKAPRDGVVIVDRDPWQDRKYQVGDKVSSDRAIVSLPDLTRAIEVRADLIDVDDGRITLGATGTCTLDAYPADPIPCVTVELTPVASPKDGQDSLRRTFSVMLSLEHRDPAHLRSGMSVRVELDPPPVTGLVISRAALRGDQVRLASGEPRVVTLGACDAQQCAITSGLADGELVAIGSNP